MNILAIIFIITSIILLVLAYFSFHESKRELTRNTNASEYESKAVHTQSRKVRIFGIILIILAIILFVFALTMLF